MNYTTIEGHKVTAGNLYTTRNGIKVFVSRCSVGTIMGMVENANDGNYWDKQGRFYLSEIHEFDIMRPWVDKKVKPEQSNTKSWCETCNTSMVVIKKWDERHQAEFINELRLIADRWKQNQIKDWGRLRSIISNLVNGNYQEYIADIHAKAKESAENKQKINRIKPKEGKAFPEKVSIIDSVWGSPTQTLTTHNSENIITSLPTSVVQHNANCALFRGYQVCTCIDISGNEKTKEG